MAEVRDLGIAGRCAVLAGVGPIRSLRALEFLRDGVPGVHVPDEVVRRLRGVPADRVAARGRATCAWRRSSGSSQIPGVAGVHVMAFGFERGVPAILERAGIGPRVCRDGRWPSAVDGRHAMLVDFRPDARLRGQDPVDLAAAVSPRARRAGARAPTGSAGSGWSATGCSTGRTSASRGRAADRRRPGRRRRVGPPGRRVPADDMEIAVDVRRAAACALRSSPPPGSGEDPAGTCSWRTGARAARAASGTSTPLYWQALELWEKADRARLRVGAAGRRERRPQPGRGPRPDHRAVRHLGRAGRAPARCPTSCTSSSSGSATATRPRCSWTSSASWTASTAATTTGGCTT